MLLQFFQYPLSPPLGRGRRETPGTKLASLLKNSWAELFKAGLLPRVSARFEFGFESLKSILVLILSVYTLMIGSSKHDRENYPRKYF